MKLELKHLAPYLPYGLRVNVMYFGKYHIEEIESAGWLSCSKRHVRLSTVSGSDITQGLTVFKPILRPMSDFEKLSNDFDLTTDFYSSQINSRKELTFTNSGSNTYLSDILTITEWLFENHFDVFGLIHADLAIDINTLKP